MGQGRAGDGRRPAASAGTDLDDPRLTDLVGELTLKSPEFARMWARHDVREKATGTKSFNHPMVGEVKLTYETSPSTARTVRC